LLRGRTPATPGGGADRHPDRDVRATRAAAEPRQCLAALDDPGSVASLLDRLREQARSRAALHPAPGMTALRAVTRDHSPGGNRKTCPRRTAAGHSGQHRE